MADDDDGFVDEGVEETHDIGDEGEGVSGTNGRRGRDLHSLNLQALWMFQLKISSLQKLSSETTGESPSYALSAKRTDNKMKLQYSVNNAATIYVTLVNKHIPKQELQRIMIWFTIKRK